MEPVGGRSCTASEDTRAVAARRVTLACRKTRFLAIGGVVFARCLAILDVACENGIVLGVRRGWGFFDH